MKLVKSTIKNFRCYKDEFEITFDNLTALLAKNDTGKSTILEALDLFFNSDKLDKLDRSVGLTSSDSIEIKAFFSKIPESIVIDASNVIDPHSEYMLNEDNELEIIKVYSGAIPKMESVLINALHPTKKHYSDLFQLNLAALKKRAKDLGISLKGVNERDKSSVRHAVWNNCTIEELSLEMQLIDIKKELWKPIHSSLPLYQLFKSDRPSTDQDSEAQDPIKFAIKEALKSKEKELKEIEEYVKNIVENVTERTIEKLREMDESLADELHPNFANVNWHNNFKVSLTNEDQVPLNKRGSGTRRLFLINFFRAKAEQTATEKNIQSVIYAIEEPETSQHPNNQRLLLDALNQLSLENKSQVILTTHNPLLATRLDQNTLRFIDRDSSNNRVILENNDDTLRIISESLGIFANHNVQVFVGLEGPNDIEFLNRISEILANKEDDIPNLRELENNGKLIYIPMGGSTLGLWSARLEGLNIPEIHICDRDNEPPKQAKYQSFADSVNSRNNCCAYITNKREMENYLHQDAINEEYSISLEALADFDDIPSLVAYAVHEMSDSEVSWNDVSDEKKSKKESKAKKRLNRGAVEKMTPELLTEVDPDNEVREWLIAIKSVLP